MRNTEAKNDYLREWRAANPDYQKRLRHFIYIHEECGYMTGHISRAYIHSHICGKTDVPDSFDLVAI